MNLVSMPLSQLATVHSGGGAPQDSAAFTRSGSPFVRAGSLPKLLDGAEEDSLELIEPEVADQYGLRLFPAGTVLFAKSGMSATKGHVYLLRKPAYVVNHLAALVPHEARDSAFLAHALRRFSPTVLIKDPAYPSIRLGDIESMRIRAPKSPGDRERIAEILDKADALRAKRRAALAQLDALAESLFLDSFGDGGSERARCKRASLADVTLRIADGVHKTPRYVDQGVPFVTVKNIVSGRLDLTDTKFITPEDHANFTRRTRPDRGDLLVSKDGTIGVPCPVETDAAFSIFVSVALVKPNPSLIDTAFLVAQFRSEMIQGQIRAGTKGIAIRHLHLEDFAKLHVVVPPLEVQRVFRDKVEAMGRLKARLSESLTDADALFGSLQHRAFRGEL